MPETYQFGDITIEFKKLDGFKGGEPIGLSAKEFEILKYFIGKEGEVVSRNDLLDDIWGYDNFPTTRTVDNYILSIRKKIEADPSSPKHLQTVHTVGYRFMN
jgi:DNA-binding response OmpR family regulator